MSRAHALTCSLLLGACTQHHLSIGSLEPDASGVRSDRIADASVPRAIDAQLEAATPADAAESFDAADSASESGPLQVDLRVFERDGVVSLSGHCGSPCTELEVVTSGGTPPYRVDWVDGVAGNKRTLCPSTGDVINDLALTLGQSVTITVTDATAPTPKQQSIAPFLLVSSCDGADAGTAASWSVCVAARPLEGVSCPDPARAGQWYALDMPLDEPVVHIRVSFSGVTSLTSTRVELYASSALCDSGSLLGAATLNPMTGWLEGTTASADASPSHMLLRAPDQPDGQLPAGLTASPLQVCFDR